MLTARDISILLFNLILVGRCFIEINSYVIPDMGREELAGIWRLTSKKSFLPPAISSTAQRDLYPMKEFTVFPVKAKIRTLDPDDSTEETMLLKLNADGSFVQYADITRYHGMEDDESEFENNELESKGSLMGLALLNGTWDFTENKLILAADRPFGTDGSKVHDTVLVGKIEATCTKRPFSFKSDISNSTKNPEKSLIASNEREEDNDVYFSVPNGKVSIGKFIYPKSHPYFFEQPIYKPTTLGKFQLQQVLGILNAKQKKDEVKQLFKDEDFHGKKFLLTSMPIQAKKKKGNLRWNRSEGKYIEDKSSHDLNEKFDVRVMPIEFFANNTFCALGLGQSKILRGRWSIIGDEKDYLWFQVRRFGFGRSLPGSVFSEGNGLTEDDERAYWGKIRWLNKDNNDPPKDEQSDINDIEVTGSLFIGWGLEPLPIGKFTMKEIHKEFLDDDDSDEETPMFDSVFE